MTTELTTDQKVQAREAARTARSVVVALGKTTICTWQYSEHVYSDPAMKIFLSEKTTHPVSWSVEVHIEQDIRNTTLVLRYTDQPEEVETYREGLWTLHLDNLLRHEGSADAERGHAPDRLSPIDDSALFGHLGARPCRE